MTSWRKVKTGVGVVLRAQAGPKVSGVPKNRQEEEDPEKRQGWRREVEKEQVKLYKANEAVESQAAREREI